MCLCLSYCIFLVKLLQMHQSDMFSFNHNVSHVHTLGDWLAEVLVL